MQTFRISMFIVAAVSAALAIYFSLHTEIQGGHSSSKDHYVSDAVAVDSGKDGGAAGFAVLSGLALLAASTTFRKEM